MRKDIRPWTTVFKYLEDGGGDNVGTLVISDMAHAFAVLQDYLPVILGGRFDLGEENM
jgi:hypothetical protein